MTLNYANFCDGTTYNPFDQVTCKSFFFTNVATITSTFTGTLSALSSLAILYAIVRSEQRFGSVYHRIMTSVAFFDFISSTAIALTTIPMPKDVLYPFQGRRVYGTVGTCETQGFAVVFGFLGSFFMFSGLMVYYVSVIQFKISDRKLKRYLEPSIQGFAWVFSLLTSLLMLFNGVYNPSVNVPWCFFESYPYSCDPKADAQATNACIRHGWGLFTQEGGKQIIMGIQFAFGFTVILLSMGFIICGSWKNNQYLYPAASTNATTTRTNTHPPVQSNDNPEKSSTSSKTPSPTNPTNTPTPTNTNPTKTNISTNTSTPGTNANLGNPTSASPSPSTPTSPVNPTWNAMRPLLIRQACMYLAAFLLTWIFVVLDLRTHNRTIDLLLCIFVPLQGFFNALIFITHHVSNIKRNNTSLSICQALNIIFLHPRTMSRTDVYFSNMVAAVGENDVSRSIIRSGGAFYRHRTRPGVGPGTVNTSGVDRGNKTTTTIIDRQSNLAAASGSNTQVGGVEIEEGFGNANNADYANTCITAEVAHMFQLKRIGVLHTGSVDDSDNTDDWHDDLVRPSGVVDGGVVAVNFGQREQQDQGYKEEYIDGHNGSGTSSGKRGMGSRDVEDLSFGESFEPNCLSYSVNTSDSTVKATSRWRRM